MRGGTLLNARRFFRVAAPSICIVPWAALASCWPLPQQLLPVSATGGGRRRCSGKIIFICSFETPAGVSKLLFHGRGRGGKRQLPRRFLRKRGAAGDYPLSLLTAFAASSPEGGAFWHLPVSRAKPPPFGGGGTAQAVTERVRSPLGGAVAQRLRG